MTARVLLAALAGLCAVLAGVAVTVQAAVARAPRTLVEALVKTSAADAVDDLADVGVDVSAVSQARRRAAAAVLSDPVPALGALALVASVAACGAVSCLTAAVIARRPAAALVVVAAVTSSALSVLLLGVLAPRTGRAHAAALAVRSARGLRVLTAVLRPVAGPVAALGSAVSPAVAFSDGAAATEAELRDLVEAAQESGVVDRAERALIDAVFDLGDTLVREVMVPRPDMVTVERGRSVRQALALALRSGFSRLPVLGEGADDIVGVAYIKDLARRALDDRGGDAVADIARGVTFVPDSKSAGELLRELQASRTHLAVVVDEYGGTAGLVTIEDILEEIVGEITDESDRDTAPVTWVDTRTVRVTARLPVHELAELTGVALEADAAAADVDTVGGLLASALGRVPIPGASVAVSGLLLVAESPKGRRNRIGTILVHSERAPLHPPPGTPVLAATADGDSATADTGPLGAAGTGAEPAGEAAISGPGGLSGPGGTGGADIGAVAPRWVAVTDGSDPATAPAQRRAPRPARSRSAGGTSPSPSSRAAASAAAAGTSAAAAQAAAAPAAAAPAAAPATAAPKGAAPAAPAPEVPAATRGRRVARAPAGRPPADSGPAPAGAAPARRVPPARRGTAAAAAGSTGDVPAPSGPPGDRRTPRPGRGPRPAVPAPGSDAAGTDGAPARRSRTRPPPEASPR